MTEARRGDDRRDGDSGNRSSRVQLAFDDLRAALGDRSSPEARAALEKLREAVLGGDAVQLRRELEDVKDRHGWLYAELARHPRVAELVNELALFGL